MTSAFGSRCPARPNATAVMRYKPICGTFIIFAVTGLMFFCSFPICGQVRGQQSDSGLVLHFDFEGVSFSNMVPDLSGRGNHGWQYNVTNQLTVSNGVFGSQAAQFSYVGFLSNDFPSVYPFSQYIAVTNLAGFEYLTNGTISLWARFDTNNDRGMYLLDNGYRVLYAPAASNSWTIGRSSTTYLNLITYPPDGSARKVVSWPNDVVRPGGLSPDLSTTAFHLYTVTFDCLANRAVSYYDGVPWQTNSIDLPWLRVYGSASLPWICIGSMSHLGTPYWGDDKYPNSAYFVGRMDDLRIYDRTLSADEVMNLYLGAGSGAEARDVAIRRSASNSVEVSWSGRSNTVYQVQYRSDAATRGWTNIGQPIASDEGPDVFYDSIMGANCKYYRVCPLP